jgi:uncharacterized cupin superfamily protein
MPTADRTAASLLNVDEGLHQTLTPAPIPREWVLSGNPVARGSLIHRSEDTMAFTALWDCTAGSFNWFYDVDEMVYIVDGAVVIGSGPGKQRVLEAGDTFFFPAGSRAQWTVPAYVRKIAFLHVPLSRKMRLARSIYKFSTRWLRGRSRSEGTAQVLAGEAQGAAQLDCQSAGA